MRKILDLEDRRIEAMQQARDRFEAGFKRTKAGILEREWEGQRLVIRRRPSGHKFVWHIVSAIGRPISSDGFEHEDDALAALSFELIFRDGDWRDA